MGNGVEVDCVRKALHERAACIALDARVCERGRDDTGKRPVDLRRNGFAKDEIRALKEAYRLLYSRVPLEQALAQMRAMNSAAVAEVADFIAASKRGFAHPTR